MDKDDNSLSQIARMQRSPESVELSWFQTPENWKDFSQPEREVIALLLLSRPAAIDGEASIVGEERCRLAERIAPKSAKLFYYEGLYLLSLSSEHDNELSLGLACDRFGKAAELDESLPNCFWGWGVALARLGVLREETRSLVLANEKFAKAHSLGLKKGLFWDWGFAWYRLACLSGEAVDYRTAIEKFEQAETIGGGTRVETSIEGGSHTGCEPISSAYWLDFGDAFTQLAHLTSEWALYRRAIYCYGQAVMKDRHGFTSWSALARSLTEWYKISGEERSLTRVVQAFNTALDIEGENWSCRLELASLLLLGGLRESNASLFRQAFEQLDLVEEGATHHSPDGVPRVDPRLFALRAQGLILLGLSEENLDALRSAEREVVRGLSVYPGSGLLACCYGDVLVARGQYFNEADPLRASMEKFASALAIDPSSVEAHLGMAKAGYFLGCLKREVAFLEKSARHLQRATRLDPLCFEAWNLWGMALMKMGELHDRREEVEEAVSKFFHPIALRRFLNANCEVEWLYNYGCALDFLGTFGEEEAYHREAAELLTHVLSLSPEDTIVRFQLGLAHFHLGELTGDIECHERAIEQFQWICREEPDEEVAWDEWGCVLLSLAHLLHDPLVPDAHERIRAQAEEKFLRAASLGCGDALYHLSCLYSHQGQYDTALSFLRRAARKGSLPAVDDLIEDEWLSDLRDLPAFEEFLNDIAGG